MGPPTPHPTHTPPTPHPTQKPPTPYPNSAPVAEGTSTQPSKGSSSQPSKGFSAQPSKGCGEKGEFCTLHTDCCSNRCKRTGVEPRFAAPTAGIVVRNGPPC